MEQQEHIQKLADEYYEEGRARFFDHKLEEAAMLVQNALHLYKKCDDMLKYATALNMLGVIYGATGNETMAVDYLVEGLECAIDYQLNNITTLFYNNIGSRYQELGEHEKAIDYFLKSARELQNPTCIKEERHRSWALITYLNLAVSYYELNLYELSYKYLEQAERQLDEEVEEMYYYTVLIFKCRLLWQMGKGDYVEAAKYMTESAIQEIKRGSKEYPAMRKIAELMYILGDIDNAYKFINVYTRNSFDYNSKYRLFELTKSYPQIEKILYQSIQKQQRQKSIFITLLLIIALLLGVAILFVFKQKRKLAFQNTVIEKQNQVLTDKTKCIEDTNQALLEAHHIKDIVLGQLIAGNANSIIYAEKIRKDICRKLKIKDYEGIKAAFEKPVDADRAFFSNIDNVILSIFPNFIDRFNSLLKEECRIVLKSKDSLVPEVRIFALIRLGISKNDDIAKCLNYSVSTVKCYKSKIMNASSLTNDEFYARLMQITFNEVS